MADAPPLIFDHALLDRRRRRALRHPVDGADFLLRRVVDDMLERLAAVKRSFTVAADIATPTPLLAATLATSADVARIVRVDRIAGTSSEVIADPEALPFAPASLDLAVSALALHWVNDLPGVLRQIRDALKPDGLMLAAFLGGDTLTELRQSLTIAESELTGGASPRVAPFVELRAAGALLQRAGFALPVIDVERHVVRYDDAFALMRDLRAMGATNVLAERSRKPLPRAVLMRAAAIYAERFADLDGRVRATFDVISLSGWAPAANQQKPLRPGAATVRLADVLGVREQSAGDKTGR